MSFQQKIQILANELTRRLSNVRVEDVESEEIREIIEVFIQEMKSSGYGVKEAREATVSGIRGWRTRGEKRKREGGSFYRHAKDTAHMRARKKLLARESWYKERRNQDQESQDEGGNSPAKIRKCSGGKRQRMDQDNIPRSKEAGKKKVEVKSVMFVPCTENSGLARKLRENEEKMGEMTGVRIKIVERVGRKMEDMLTRSDPWKGQDCLRKNCFLCSTKERTGKGKKKSCTKRNIVYEPRCLTCEKKEKEKVVAEAGDDKDKLAEELKKIKLFKYIGETHRSAYERGIEHLDDLISLSEKSHMLRHIVYSHEGEAIEEIEFGMKILKYARSAFERQVEEAVLIQQERVSHNLLNSKSEYNSCALPRLETRMGEGNMMKEMKLLEREMEIEREQEEDLKDRIRVIRKSRNSARLDKTRGVPSAKRRKTGSGEYISIREIWGNPQRYTAKKTPAEDAEEDQEHPRPQVELPETKKLRVEVTEEEEGKEEEFPEVKDWDRELERKVEEIQREVAENIQKEEEERDRRETAWELAKECEEYLSDNNTDWERKRHLREAERRNRTRAAEMKHSREEWKNDLIKERTGEQQEENLPPSSSPSSSSEAIRMTEKRKGLKEMRKTLQSLKMKERKYKVEGREDLEKIENDDDKMLKVVDELKEMQAERGKGKKRMMNEGRRKKKLTERWGLMIWITRYLEENWEKWERERRVRRLES